MSAIDIATVVVFTITLLLQAIAGLMTVLYEDLNREVSIQDEPVPYSHGNIGGLRGGGKGILFWIYTHKARDNVGDRVGGDRFEDARWFSNPWRPFDLPLMELLAFQRLLRQLSLLLLAVMGIIRFALGEPILNLF